MKILVVHAHENPDSFCSSLMKKILEIGAKYDHEVVISDLYAQQFNPVGSKRDFTNLSEAPYYKYALEQLHRPKPCRPIL